MRLHAVVAAPARALSEVCASTDLVLSAAAQADVRERDRELRALRPRPGRLARLRRLAVDRPGGSSALGPCQAVEALAQAPAISENYD
jgi:hypothetical protein